VLHLSTTSELLRVITADAVTVDVHASWVDMSGTTVTPGATNTAISTATTTTIVAAPASSTVRNVKLLSICNRHASSYCTVTLEIYNGSVAYQIDKRRLGPGENIFVHEGVVVADANPGVLARPWHGIVYGCYGDGDPGRLMHQCQKAANIAATPTAITTSIARCSVFTVPANITVNRLRAYGVGATTSVYRVALYDFHTTTRLMAETAFSTTAGAWVSIGATLGVTLTKDRTYCVAVSVNATGTTAGCQCFGTTTTTTTGNIGSSPANLPGSMALSTGDNPGTYLLNFQNSYLFQFAVSTGALPTPAAQFVPAVAWTGGMPAIWVDSSDT
jgi:hypothetical protein